MTAEPLVCVVVSAYDRSHLLPALVAALRAQTLDRFEAVLVDNGSTDDTYEQLQRLTAGDDRFRVLRLEGNRGPARARNLAWRSTTAPWIAFTDDDCEPEPTWLEELLAVGAEAEVVQGWTGEVLGPEPAGWFDRTQRIDRFTNRYETCNLLVARDVLAQLDGFDETFPIAMGEDTDLGFRAVDAGARTAFAPRAVVRHHVWRTGFAGYLRQQARLAEQVELVRVNPAVRQNLRWGYVVGGTHLLVWGLVPTTAVGVVTGRPWLPLVPVALWCGANAYWTRHRPFPVSRRLGYSTLQFVGKAYETWCYARASVRYRRLVI